MNITQLLNNNCFPGRNGYKPLWLIIHGTAGGTSALEIAQFFLGTTGGSNPVSAHYIVDEQGIIYQATLETDAAWANGVVTTGHDPWWNADGNPNPNNVTLSIEHVKPDNANATALTPAQQAASFALIKDICERNGIPMRAADTSGGITSHASIDPINRARCPRNFPWQDLWNYLNNGETTMSIDLTNPTVASHFVAAPNGAWHCPSTNATIGGEILATYQKFGGDAFCGLTYWGLPLTSEIPIPEKPGTVLQRFERAVAAFDPNHTIDSPPGSGRVYLLHIDSGIGQDPRVTDLQGQVTALTAQLAALQPAALAATNTALQAKIAQAVKDLQG